MSKFRPKTVFVLGAGASWPYGFPTGVELRREILRNLSSKNYDDFQMLVNAGFDGDAIWAFYNAFRRSQQDSIDAFLTWAAKQNSSFVDIGRAAIAQALIRREVEDWLFAEDDEDVPSRHGPYSNERLKFRWYRYLWNRITDEFQNLRDANVTFLTFNYDRSLEHFLFTAIHNTHLAEEGSVPSVMERIPVVHVHGRIGQLPWQKNSGEYQRAYTPRLDSHVVMKAAEWIRIPGTESPPDQQHHRAAAELYQAERIVFLGFGYHPDNLRTLKVPEVLQQGCPQTKDGTRYVCGTAYGLKEAERHLVLTQLQGTTELLPASYDCLELLRQSPKLAD